MKKLIVTVAALFFVFGLSTHPTNAQNSYDDGGLLVVEDSFLSPSHKQIVFVVAKDISQSTKIEIQTYDLMEGVFNTFKPLRFPQGVRRGQIIPIWNGDLTLHANTPWLYFWVTMSTGTGTYYTSTMFPIDYQEQYKEPMITSISETGGYGIPYTITAKGIFDTTMPSLILINTNVLVSPKVITQTRPGIIQFTMPSGNFEQFAPGKYLLTICQAGHCDTLQGRHR